MNRFSSAKFPSVGRMASAGPTFQDVFDLISDRNRGFFWTSRNVPPTLYGPSTLVADPFHGTVLSLTRYGGGRVSADGFDSYVDINVGSESSRAYGYYDSLRHRIFVPSDSSTNPDVWSDDGGYTWTLGDPVVSKVVQRNGTGYNAVHDTHIISAVGQVFVSTDGGETFNVTQTGDLWTRSVICIRPDGTTLHVRWYSTTNQLSTRISTDGGLTWGAVNNILVGSAYVCHSIVWSTLSSRFVLSCNGFILTSADGVTWDSIPVVTGECYILVEDPFTRFLWRAANTAPSSPRISLSTDGGRSWRTHDDIGKGGYDSSVTLPLLYDMVFDRTSRRFIRVCENSGSPQSVVEISPP